MLDLAAELTHWRDRDYAVATVISTGGSAPRPPGAALAVDGAGEAIGSVSGGCVEGAVYALCQDVLETGTPVVESFGYSDDDAFAVGLTCGGTVEVAVRRVAAGETPSAFAAGAAAAGRPIALATVVDGPAGLLGGELAVAADGTSSGALDDAALDRTVRAEAAARLDTGATGLLRIGADGTVCGEPVSVFVQAVAPPPRLLVFGAIDFAAALVRVGKLLGYRVTVCDARPVFTTANRFPEADEVLVEWPHRYLERTETDGRTVVCVLTHDAKFDVPLLAEALRRDVGYVGAMGSRRTHEQRLDQLRDEAGLTEAQLARLRSPIGLDLGARTPEETALSILAEVVASRRGGSGMPLSRTGGPIHHDTGAVANGAVRSVA